ncbi:NAD(P)-dependent oxidoreductase [Pollutimonas thiosulfatoxidans]|uniref:NAD(P)-dependent oxidoreductase n=1 Tax=Pollutimonas thiosulfatoxidans TaxID=2028345 RepID=UPI0013E2A83E|nr:NAD(P)-dependent oxidoreductase [Pollutimonas thiosulfatoxidans]
MKILKAAPGLDPHNYLAAQLPDDVVTEADFSRPLGDQVADAEVLLLRDVPITKEVIDAAPRLKLLQRYGQHIVDVDIAYARSRGVPVARVPSSISKSDVVVAEHAFYLMMALAKRQIESQQAFGEGRLGFPETQLLAGKTLALIGVGGTGAQLARMAYSFGMEVLASKRNLSDLDGADAYIKQTWPAAHMQEMLSAADYVSLHLPLNRGTRGTIDNKVFHAMKASAYFINIARGEIVDKAALLRALDEQRIAGAGIDVFWDEDNFNPAEFEGLKNLLCTPHIAGASVDCLHALADAVALNVNRIRDGKAPLYSVEDGDD